MTVYELCKFLIDCKRYAYNAMLKKVNVFYANDQMAEDEYTKLLTQLDEQKAPATDETQA